MSHHGRAHERIEVDADTAHGPAAILRAVQAGPKPSEADVDALEQAIQSGRLSVRDSGLFDQPDVLSANDPTTN